MTLRSEQEYLEEGVPVLVPTTYENEDDETVYADAEVVVEPGTAGFARAFVDELSSPFGVGVDAINEYPLLRLLSLHRFTVSR